MLQEISDDTTTHSINLHSVPKTKKRSWVPPPVTYLPDCYITQRVSPKLYVQFTEVPLSMEAKQTADCKDFAWLILRHINSTDQAVPGWAGFVSLIGSKPDRLTKLEYYPVIYKPITEYSTVQECLKFVIVF